LGKYEGLRHKEDITPTKEVMMINLLKTTRTLIPAAMLGLALAGPSNAFAAGNETTLKNAGDMKWELMLPELGKDSPRYTILRVDPKTNATTLMIEFPTAIHIPRHTHDKSETHFLLKGSHTFGHEGKLFHVNEGGYFYMDGGMVHEAWVPAGAKAIIVLEDGWKVDRTEGAPTAVDLGKGTSPSQ
jgi:quercetin dioxygenase-like cupin family protein